MRAQEYQHHLLLPTEGHVRPRWSPGLLARPVASASEAAPMHGRPLGVHIHASAAGACVPAGQRRMLGQHQGAGAAAIRGGLHVVCRACSAVVASGGTRRMPGRAG